MKILSIVCLIFLPFFGSSEKNAEELGKVDWLRNYDEAILKSKAENKPILILFQEVPGCATCRNYGHNVLSHPLMMEAIENEFIPLAIFNNKKGKDAEILKKYNEPSWNNPVVRIVNSKGDNIINRIASDYSASTLAKGMASALKNYGISTPVYLNLLIEELASSSPGNSKESYYKMYCFWTGEKKLGSVSGVINTESGFVGPSEVVRVTYNPEKVDINDLNSFAENNKMGLIADGDNFQIAKNDLHYYLQNSDYKYLPLSDYQKTKINSALGRKQDAEKYLSPTQRNWLINIQNSSQKGKIRIHMDLEEAWASIEASGI